MNPPEPSSHPQDPTAKRQPRGSYAKLICLNCRARKIKCNLPTDFPVEPSPSPQPPDRACTRCQQQGLDCIVDKTVLGRPTQKRQRPSKQPKNEDWSLVDDDTGIDPDLDPDVQDFVLSDLRDEVHEIGSSIAAPPGRSKPSKHEIFESLMDSTHLFAALMSRDAKFGSLVFASGVDVDLSVDVTKLVSDGLAALLDEHLVWHRLNAPYLPTLRELRETLLTNKSETRSASSTRALFVLLCVIASDVPSQHLHISASLRNQLQLRMRNYCQLLMFDLPVHRHTLYVLDLVTMYKPLAFASTISVVAPSIKGNMSTTLAKCMARRLGFDTAAEQLENQLLHQGDIDAQTVKDLSLEALQWCQWVLLESIIDGYVMKTSTEQRSPLPEARKILSAVKKAVERVPMRPGVLHMYHHLSSAIVEMQAAVAAKQHWLDLAALARLIESHGQKCEAHKEYIHHLLEHCDRTDNLSVDEDITAISELRITDLNASHIRIAGLSMFYGLMSGLRPPQQQTSAQTSREITPDEAVQVSSEIITNLKTKHNTLSDPASVASFISRHGDPRFARQEQALRDFVTSADTLRLAGISYTPPPIPTVSMLLQTCREIVENNSTRLKGWGSMHPNVDVHVLLLQDVAKKLDGMDAAGGSADAISRGCIYASGAKLIRSLCGILAGWRKTLIEREVKDTAAKGAEATMSWGIEGMETFSSDDLFDDWNEWPQAEDLDFSELLADGMEWVDWAQFTSPSEGSSQS